MANPQTILFCGGGSGGHLYPGVAVAEELRKRSKSFRAVFVGSTRDIERTVLSDSGFDHETLDVLPAGTLLRSPLRFIRTHRAAVKRSLELIDEHKPSAVLGLGSFASVPVVTAAAKRNIPIVLLEQNRIAGRATRWLSRKASAVCISFPETTVGSGRPEVVFTGNPVRANIVAARDANTLQNTLLVIGGSQGAVRLNDLILSSLSSPDIIPDRWDIVHQTGPRDEEGVRSHYQAIGVSATVGAFFHDMPSRYASAGIVITRAGGTTLAELACIGRASILVPYPNSVGDHQLKNAQCFAESNAAILIEHDSDQSQVLGTALKVLADRDERERMASAMKLLGAPDAASSVADVVARLSN